MSETVRGRALFSGMVQGVGFRFTTRHVAARFAVTGYVRNLPTGEVEVVAEGKRAEILAFLASIREEMEHYVHDLDVRWGTATGEFDLFHIRH
ncbi:MAG: acylphosphatase [Planctomycetota bacterium]|jgi:acylphosphatase